MTLKRTVAYLCGCVAFAASFLVYLEYIYLLGFPDGFITELEYAERRLAFIFIGVSVIAGSCFVYLGGAAARKKFNKQLFAAIILYLIFVLGVGLTDYYYRLHLTGSGGG